VADPQSAQIPGDRGAFTSRGLGESLAELPRRRVYADLAARLPVNERQLANVGQVVLAAIADLDCEDVVVGRHGRQRRPPVAGTTEVRDDDDHATARRGAGGKSERRGGRLRPDRGIGSVESVPRRRSLL
jgi:hypothetical protein